MKSDQRSEWMRLEVWRRRDGVSYDADGEPREPVSPKRWAYERIATIGAQSPNNLSPHTHIDGRYTGCGVGMIFVDEANRAWLAVARGPMRAVVWDETEPTAEQLRLMEEAKQASAAWVVKRRQELSDQIARIVRPSRQRSSGDF